MVQTFILTRSFAISALFAGAFPVTYAAPIPNVVVHEARHYPRGCRLMGCLYALPTPANAANATNNAPPQSTLSADSLQILDFLISALTSARDSLSSAPPTAIDAVTADSPESVVEELAESLSSSAEAITADTSVPAVEVTPVDSEATSLDALE